MADRAHGASVAADPAWGVGGLTFGLAIRYLGIALGYAIALGLCTAFGTLVPPIFHRQDAGSPIARVAKAELLASGGRTIFQNLSVLVVVLWSGFATNFVWSAILIFRNRSAGQFAGEPGRNPMRAVSTSGDTLVDLDPADLAAFQRLSGGTLVRNYFFAVLAGVIWYFQFFFYSMGQTQMGKYDFSSWTLHMASIIIFATLWGIFLNEWKGTSRRTKTLVTCGLLLLIGSTIIVGYGNYLKVAEIAAGGR